MTAVAPAAGSAGLRLGFHTGYWASGPPPGAADAVHQADELDLDSIWTAEAYGSDALTPLAWWGAATREVRLGTAVMQMAARTPAATAMAALTLDHLSGGRFVLGLGVSGPQVVEGWYGQPYARPLERTREYLDVVRQVLVRQEPVTIDGRHLQLPLHPGSARHVTGEGKALRSTVHPLRPDLPIHLAAQGPRNTALAAEIADGWLPAFYSPKSAASYREQLATGFARRDASRRPAADFEVAATVPVALGADVESAAEHLRPHFALYIGGMGSASTNFHRAAIARLGHEDACERVAALWQRGEREAAAAAVPVELVLDVALAGNPAQLREQLATWSRGPLTTLIIQTPPQALAAVVSALRG